MNNSNLIDYTKLMKEDMKLNDKLIISYHLKYKLKYFISFTLVSLTILYLIANIRLGDRFSFSDALETLPLFASFTTTLFFMFDMIKWGLERYGIFKPREIKICKYAHNYLEQAYLNEEITEEELNRMKLIYILKEANM